jgi:hypothetical protein
MLEEFAASLASSRIVAWPPPERLLSPPVAPQLQDEDPMLEEFAASLASSRIIVWPPPERPLSPPVAPNYKMRP